MPYTRVFKSGNSQALRLPKEFRFGELGHGAEKSQAREKTLLTMNHLIAAIPIMPMMAAVGQHYGQIRADLERKGQPIGNNDLWIAAHARAEGCILVTNNEREFARIEGLQIENWAP